MTSSERANRIAANEASFREINATLHDGLSKAQLEQDEPVAFVCECGTTECTASVSLTVAEYEQVRQDPTTFAMVPGHDIEDVEDVVFTNDRYAVARKKPPSWPVVVERDRRTDSG